MLKRNGFTLIELLISITIISVLSVVGMVSYTSFLRSSRDNKRTADLRFIQSALEEYHSDLLIFPIATAINALLPTGGVFSSDTGRGTVPAPTNLKTYFNSLPKDPIASTTTPYCYVATPSGCDNSATKCTSYILYAKFENPPSATTYSCNSITYNFQMTPP
jgi:prepilin-type N-terminal cleavage/methylation domain-containing protein